MNNLASDSSTPLTIDQIMRRDLKEIAGWAMFLSIVMWVLLAIVTVIILAFGLLSWHWNEWMLAGMEDAPVDESLMMGPFTNRFTLLLLLLVYGFFIGLPAVFLYRFAKNIKNGLRLNSASAIREGFAQMKYFFRFYGILMAFFIGFYILIIIVSVIAFVLF